MKKIYLSLIIGAVASMSAQANDIVIDGQSYELSNSTSLRDFSVPSAPVSELSITDIAAKGATAERPTGDLVYNFHKINIKK